MKTQEIEIAFDNIYQIATSQKRRSKNNDIENIRIVMKSNPQKIWWFAHDLMGEHIINGDKFFIGSECSARLSQLSEDTHLIESRRAGKYIVRRYRFENFIN